MRLSFALFALAACSGDSSSDTGDATSTDAPAAGAIEPVSGSWTYIQTSVDADSCGIADLLVLDAGAFAIVNGGDGTFTVDDGTYQFDCTLDGADFTCPDRFGGEGTVGTGGIAFAISGEANGTFSSDSAAVGSQSGEADCTDSVCEAAAGLLGFTPPCAVAVSYTIGL